VRYVYWVYCDREWHARVSTTNIKFWQQRYIIPFKLGFSTCICYQIVLNFMGFANNKYKCCARSEFPATWWWRQEVPPKRQEVIIVYGVITQKTVLFTHHVFGCGMLFRKHLVYPQTTALGKNSSNPITVLDRPWSLQETEAPRISRQSAHEGGKVVSSTHQPPLPPRDISGAYFCYSLSRPQSTLGIGNRPRDLPACSAVPQPTAPPRAPHSTDQKWTEHKKSEAVWGSKTVASV
jgi:hypothetical protein